jgi:hypothetical protein
MQYSASLAQQYGLQLLNAFSCTPSHLQIFGPLMGENPFLMNFHLKLTCGKNPTDNQVWYGNVISLIWFSKPMGQSP